MTIIFKFQLFIVLCVSVLVQTQAQKADDVLLRVGKTDVSVGEFRYIYEKNNGTNADYSEQSINEYLDLYTKFKLKVEKAKQIKLDTIEALKSELEGYRKQLAGSYLIDKEVTEFLLKELYERTKYDVEFSHIFIAVPDNASNKVREDAFNKLKDIKSQIVTGLITFEDAAKNRSEDRATALNGGKMGYFTAKLPSGFYELESAIYQLPIGQISDVVRSKIGYHLIKVTNKRPARGLIEVAHILIDQNGAAKAETIYNQIKGGGDFNALSDANTIDLQHKANGGKLPIFGINTYDTKFEDAAYDLKNQGDVSKPVLTNSGWHIIKLINKINLDSYETFVKKMKSQISKDERFNAAKLKLVDDIKKASGFQVDLKALQAFTSTLNDEFYTYKWTSEDHKNDALTLFSYGGKSKYSVKDFVEFCKMNTRTRLKYDNTKPINETVDELFTDFVNQKALEFEEKNLPIKYPDFKSLMREYEEGILLFEITRINVWDKANQDTVGLKSYFQHNQKAYNWPEKANLTTFDIKSVDKAEIDKIYSFAGKNDPKSVLKKFNGKTEMVTLTESQCDKQSKECTNFIWKKGFMSPPEMSADGYKFTQITQIVPPTPKSLHDARGYVVADYQDYLEKEWIKQLSKEFKVVIMQDILKKLKK